MGKKPILYFLIVLMVLIGLREGFILYSSENKTVLTASISVGSSGDSVKQIQERLKELGYYKGSVDGIFGSGTLEAVKLFQENFGLTPDGVVGEATLKALGITLGGNVDNLSENDISLIASAIYGEGRGEPFEGQVAIGAVILNRVKSEKFPNTVSGVIYQKGAFDAVSDGQINLTPDETAIAAAREAAVGSDPTGGALYYWNPQTATSVWIWSVPITTQIGRHVFGTK